MPRGPTMSPDPKPADDGDKEATLIFCKELAQSLEDDITSEGYFYQSAPQFASLAKPPI